MQSNSSVASKPCLGCKKIFPLTDYYTQTCKKNGKVYRQSYCKPCTAKNASRWHHSDKGQKAHRKQNLQQCYGMTQEEYDHLYAKQQGLCAICGLVETATNRRGKVRCLSVDHNHVTGQIRGLLCVACNSGLGHFRDKTSNLVRALSYLRSFM